MERSKSFVGGLNSLSGNLSANRTSNKSIGNSSNNIRTGQRASTLNYKTTSKTSLFKEHSDKLLKKGADSEICRKPELKFPATSGSVLEYFPDLPEWLKNEISAFEVVFYFNEKRIVETFDDSNGDYVITLGSDFFYRYEFISILGKGTFGQVVKCIDHQDKKQVALKIIKNREKYTQQANMEIEILSQTKSDYIVTFQSSFSFRNHIVLVFELLGINLYEVLKRSSFTGLPLSQIRIFSKQILQALSVLSNSKIIHCDLKPENILVKDSKLNSIKLIDFGSSCFEDQQIYTYIQSRFYRAPEVVLGGHYTRSIDIWSFGCILVEMFTGAPLFPAENERELLARMIEVLGDPPKEVFCWAKSKEFFGENKKLKTVAKKSLIKKDLKGILKGADKELLKIIECCLKWRPEERVSPQDALNFVWVSKGEVEIKKKYKESLEKILKNKIKTGRDGFLTNKLY